MFAHSMHSHASMAVQFDYYNIPFCEPRGGEKELSENLGEVLAGERTETSAYKLHANVTRLCKVACRKRWTPKAVREFRDFAGANFRANMRLDNLPGALQRVSNRASKCLNS